MLEYFLPIAAIIAAIALLILCSSLVVSISAIKRDVQSTSKAVRELSVQFDSMKAETTHISQRIAVLENEVKEQVKQVQTVSFSLEAMQENLTVLDQSVNQVVKEVHTEPSKEEQQLAQVVQVSKLAMSFIEKVKERKADSDGWVTYDPTRP